MLSSREQLISKIDRLEASNASQAQMKRDFYTLLQSGREAFENDNFNPGHITASGFLLNRNGTHVLLTEHKKLNMWLQLGGHSDGNSDTLSTALRETKEESGLETIKPISSEIFDIDIHIFPAQIDKGVPEHLHFDIRYLLQADTVDGYSANNESHQLKWFTADEAMRVAGDDSVKRMIKKWQLSQKSRNLSKTA